MLSNYQLLSITSAHYCTMDTLEGVYSVDRVPNTVSKYPSFFISNSKPEGHPGEHWFALFFPNKSQPSEFFCSLGKKAEFYGSNIVNALRSNGNGDFMWNKYQVQSNTSQACAYFVLYFIDLRSRGVNYSDCMNTLSSLNLESNELKVTSYVKTHMIP